MIFEEGLKLTFGEWKELEMKIEALITSVLALALCSPTAVSGQTEPVEATANPESRVSEELKNPQNDPQWFEKLLARTVEKIPAPLTVAPQDKSFQASIPATLIKPIESVEGAHVLTLDYGAGAANFAECYVYEEALDMAGGLMSLSSYLFGVIEQNYGELELKRIAGLDAKARDMVPTLSLDWIYRSKGNESTGGAMVGQTNHRIATKDGRSLYCHSTSPGFDAAFDGLFESFVDTATFPESESDHYYRDLSLVSLGQQAVGIARSSHRIDEDGDIERRESVAFLFPVDQSTLQAKDSEVVEYSTLAGDVIAKIEIEASNGELTTNLRLAEGEDGWEVSGVFEGKELNAELGKRTLRSDFGQRLDFMDFVKTAKADAVLKVDEWSADLDPTSFQQTDWIFKGRDDDRFNLDFTLGPLSMSGVLDSQASVLAVSIPMGASSLEIRRLVAEGNPMHPTTLARAEESVDSTVPAEPETIEGRSE